MRTRYTQNRPTRWPEVATGVGTLLLLAGTAFLAFLTGEPATWATSFLAAGTLVLFLGFAFINRSVRWPESASDTSSDEVEKSVEQLTSRFSEILTGLEHQHDEHRDTGRERSRSRHLDPPQPLSDEFVSLLTHELRTPLTSVRSYLELLLQYNEDVCAEERQEFLRIICGQVHRLSRLINDLLDMSRLRSGKFQINPGVFALRPILWEVRRSLEGLAVKKHQRIKVSDISNGLFVFCDGDRLIQILTNLVGNALKYGPQNSTITISATAAGGKQIEITVTDEGTGIPEEEKERIFEPFYRIMPTSGPTVEGTGLGLYLSRELARQMQGDLSVECLPGEGARFTVRLPLSSESEVYTSAEEIQPSPTA